MISQPVRRVWCSGLFSR